MSAPEAGTRRRPRLDRALRLLPGAMLAVAGLVGLVPDLLDLNARISLAAALGALAVVCFAVGEARAGKWAREYLPVGRAVQHVGAQQAMLEATLPSPNMTQLADVLLSGKGAGRLTVYEIRQSSDALHAVPLARFSSNRMFEDAGRASFGVQQSFMRDVMQASLTGRAPIHVNESGTLPDPMEDFEGWRDTQATVVGDVTTAASLRMQSRKYGWAIVADRSEQRRAIALMVESTDPSGVNVSELRSPLLYVVLNQFLHDLTATDDVRERSAELGRALVGNLNYPTNPTISLATSSTSE